MKSGCITAKRQRVGFSSSKKFSIISSRECREKGESPFSGLRAERARHRDLQKHVRIITFLLVAVVVEMTLSLPVNSERMTVATSVIFSDK